MMLGCKSQKNRIELHSDQTCSAPLLPSGGVCGPRGKVMCWVVFPRPPPASLLGLEVTPRMKEERLAKINNAFHGFVIFFQIYFELENYQALLW